MMNLLVKTPDEILAGLRRPQLEPVTRIELHPDDWLIVCAGFEDRALTGLKSAVGEKSPFKTLLVLYEPFIRQNKADDIRRLCKRATVDVVETTYNRQDPSGFGDTLSDVLTGCRGRVFLDVSAMSRLLIVQTIVALQGRPRGLTNCFILYSEAQTYPPSRAEAEAELAKSKTDPTLSVLFLSSGVFDVTIVPELSSFALPGAQTRLVAFPSLDAHQLTALRAELQPSRFTFIEGLPPTAQNQWRKSVISQLNYLDSITDAERFATSTLAYAETLDLLLRIYSENTIRERLIVSPTGSKMQTVAVAIFRSFIEDVQIVFPTPLNFLAPEHYTVGEGDMHLLPLEQFSVADGRAC
ncbi:MAG TPA: hypothetical protein VN687_06870 [Blastocatellia bacterium]|nr:hypothetical protein [Blastocatellia bacterium]